MTSVQVAIQALRDKGWTVTALAEQLGVRRETLHTWTIGTHQPYDMYSVLDALQDIMEIKRIPKGKRYAYPRTHIGPVKGKE